MSRRLRHGWPLGAWPPSPSGRGLLLRAARQRAGAPSRWAGLGVSHRPEAHRDAMISLLPRRLRTADPREGHRPGGGAGGLGPPGRYRPDAVLADAGLDGHRGRGAIGAAVVAGSAALPGSGPDKGIEVNDEHHRDPAVHRDPAGQCHVRAARQQLVAVRFFLLAPCRSIPSPVPQPHGSGPWPTGLAWLGAMDEPATYLSHIELQRWSVRGPA